MGASIFADIVRLCRESLRSILDLLTYRVHERRVIMRGCFSVGHCLPIHPLSGWDLIDGLVEAHERRSGA